MKKIAWAFMTAFVSLAMVFTSCAKPGDEPSDPSKPDQPVTPDDPSKPDQPVNPDPEEIEFPEISVEGSEAVIAFYVPEGVDCNGIVFKGTSDNWNASSGEEWELEQLEEGSRWYTLTWDTEKGPKFAESGGAEVFVMGKPCLLDAEGKVATNWDSQWSSYEINADNGNPSSIADGVNGENMVGILEAGSVAYIIVEKFATNYCVANDLYSISLKLPALCNEDDEVGLMGNFPASGWSTDLFMEFDEESGLWIAEEVEAQADNKFKVRLNADWNAANGGDGLKVLNPETGTYDEGIADQEFGEDLEISLDWSEGYAWAACLPAVGE